MRHSIAVCLALCGILLAAPVMADTPAASGGDAGLDALVAKLVSQMTVQEKVALLAGTGDKSVARLGIPTWRTCECLHGVTTDDGATSFPSAVALGATWDPPLVGHVAEVIAKEARALGMHQGFAPMLGLAIDPRWGRVEESYGEDPYLVTRLGVAYIEGLQGMGADRLGPDHIIATPKHFVADGEPAAGSNGGAMEISESYLRETHMQPFEAAVREARTESIMPAHHALNEVPCHANAWLLQNVLRDQWGFDGFVASDFMDICNLYQGRGDGHHIAGSNAEASRMALTAGVEVELGTGAYDKTLVGEVNSGRLPMAVLDRAVTRVLRVRLRLLAPAGTAGDGWAKLFQNGKLNLPPSGRRADFKDVLSDPAHDALALQAAREAIVLLKNQGGLLPLDRTKIHKIAVVGPLAEQMDLGGYSTKKPKFYVNVVDGLKTAAGAGVEVDYSRGCNIEDDSDALLADAVKTASQADVVIAVVGTTRAVMGENLDRDSLDLVGGQEKLVEAVQGTGKPTVVVLLNGGALTIGWISVHVPAIVEGFYGGQATGAALADVLLGSFNPGGKMAYDTPASVGLVPCCYDHLPYARAMHYYGLNLADRVMYPFGFGLSYTTFAISDLKISPNTIDIGSLTGSAGATVTVTVKNTGGCAGDEVVQLYLHQEVSTVDRPVKQLEGFKRITLKPGESQEVSFPIGFDQLKLWKGGKWIVEPGDFTVWVGDCSADERLRGSLQLIQSDK